MVPTIAVLGHSGWLGEQVVPALIKAGFLTKVISRSGSSRKEGIPGTEVVGIDWSDASAFIQALTGVDIVLSLVGQPGLAAQMALPPILAEAGIKLFIPSDFAFTHTSEEDELVPVMKNKEALEHELRKYGVPFLNILSGNFAEFALNTLLVGIDLPNNRIVYTGGIETQHINLCTREYVAAAIPQILTSQALSALAGRAIGLTELTPSGADIASALAKHNGAEPKIARETDEASIGMIKGQHPLALPELVKLKWSRGEHSVGHDVFDVQGYEKATTDDLIGGGKLQKYKDLPFPFSLDHYFAST